MSSFYEEVDLASFSYNSELQTFFFLCPCGDFFQITLDEILDGEEIAYCPSCSLIVRIVNQDKIIKSLTKNELELGNATEQLQV